MSNKKTIVIACSVSMSEPAVRNRVEPFFNKFIDNGYVVKLVCPRDDDNRHLVRSDVEILEVDIPETKINNFFKRAFSEVKASRNILLKVNEHQYDAVLLVIPSMFLAFTSPFFIAKKNTFLDICDLSWEYLSDKKITHFLSKRFFRVWFKLVINFFTGIIVTNPTEEKYVCSIRRDQSTVKIVPNGITQSQFDRLQSSKNVSRNKRIRVTYVGNVGLAQCLDTLIETALKLPDIDFVIVGGGTDFERIEKKINSMCLNNLDLMGRVPWDEVKKYYSSTDILYAQLAPDYATAVPSKLYEYFSTGKYVIYGGMAQAAERMREFEHNQVIEPCNSDVLVEAIKCLLEKDSMGVISESNIQRVKDFYIRENTAEQLVFMVNAAFYSESKNFNLD